MMAASLPGGPNLLVAIDWLVLKGLTPPPAKAILPEKVNITRPSLSEKLHLVGSLPTYKDKYLDIPFPYMKRCNPGLTTRKGGLLPPMQMQFPKGLFTLQAKPSESERKQIHFGDKHT